MRFLHRRRPPEEDSGDIIYVSLVSAIDEGGCPICRLLSKVEVSALQSLLYEHVNDPYVRKLIIHGWGLCQYHSWLMARLAMEDHSPGSGLGPAIIMEDLLSRYLEALNKGTFPEAGSGCYVCKQLQEFEEVYVESFALEIESTDLLSKYATNSKSVLCSRHFNMIIKLANKNARERLLEIQRAKLENLVNTVREYINKHDYRCQESITKEEAESWLLAIEALVGLRALLSGLHRVP